MKMGWKNVVTGAVCTGVLLAALVTTVAQTVPVRIRATAEPGKETSGEVMLNGSTVIILTASAGGFSAFKRAEIVADRLNQLLSVGAGPADFLVAEQSGGWTIHAKRINIVTATAADARALRTTAERLSKYWRDTIVDRMQILISEAQAGTVDERNNESAVSAEEPEAPRLAAAPTREQSPVQVPVSKKIVPIISLGQGLNIGAAQVVGPSFRVDQVKAVAQIEADFKRAAGARIRAMVPISTERIVSNLSRVDQVAVSMYGDVDPRKLF